MSTKRVVRIYSIPSKFVRFAADVIASPITKIFNKSLETATYPDDWKRGNVSPIHKGGSPLDANNYRPITLLPIISKVMERLVRRQLQSYILENNLLSCFQSAFRPNHSTEDVLVKSVDDWLSAMDNKCLNVCTFLDVRKAFDCVDHQILLTKLCRLGVERSSLNWFSSFLQGRYQRVSTKVHKSTWFPCMRGVPQGSVLGPLLFSLYINDLPDVVTTGSINIFADDTCLYTSGYCISDTISSVNKNLDRVHAWFKDNKMELNLSKTKSMIIGCSRLRHRYIEGSSFRIMIYDQPVEIVSKYKYLGVIIDENLSWKDHIDYIASRVSQRLAILRCCREFLPQSSRVLFYKSCIRPVMEYSSVAWSNCCQTVLKRLASLEGYAARLITNSKPRTRTQPLLDELHLPRLKDRLDYFQAVLTYRCVHNLARGYMRNIFTFRSSLCSRVTRNSKSLLLPRPRTNFMKRTFHYRGSQLWNNLPATIKTYTTLPSSKKNLKTLLLVN